MDVSSKNGQIFPPDSRLKRAANTISAAALDFGRNDGPQWAAAIAYYSILSTFPLLLAVVSVAAFFVQPEWVIEQITSLLGEYLPQGEVTIEDVVQSAFDARGRTTVISVALLLWGGTRVFGVLAKGLNTTYDKTRQYSLRRRLIVELAMALGLGLLFVFALISRNIVQTQWNRHFSDSNGPAVLLFTLEMLIPGLLLFTVFYLIYRYVPNRPIDAQPALAGAAFTTVVVLVSRRLFLGYLYQFAQYSLIYGSLAAVVVLIVWAWITAMIVLLGGQITSKIQRNHMDPDAQRAE